MSVEFWSLVISAVRLWGVSIVVQLCLGLSMAVIFAGCLGNSQRIQKGSADDRGFLQAERKAWRREIPLFLQFGVFTGLWAVFGDHCRSRGIIPLDSQLVNDSVQDTALTVFWQFWLYFVLFDTYYYFLHRYVLHNKRLLWWVHESHHR